VKVASSAVLSRGEERLTSLWWRSEEVMGYFLFNLAFGNRRPNISH
jgi:hypothetical protein